MSLRRGRAGTGVGPWQVCVTLVGLVLLSGCVSTSVYPDHWAERIDADGDTCPVIDGEYVNEGEYFERVDDGGLLRRTASLGELLCVDCTETERLEPGSVGSVTGAYERFRLELSDEKLAVTAIATDGSMHRHEQPVRQDCRDAMRIVEAGWWSSLEEEDGWEVFGATLGMSIVERASLKFGRAEDGSLLVRHSSVGSLMVLQWPIFPMAQAEWVRFPAVTGSPESVGPAATSATQVPLQAGMPPPDH